MNVIINGVNSDTINGLQILSLPPITKPRMRTSIATIDGRPGDIVTPLGYEAYNKTIKILLHDTYDLPAIMAYFNQSGTIIFSNDPDMVYTFETIEAINYERAVKFKTASVTIHVQPYKTSASEQPSEAESESFMDSEPYLFRASGDATMQIGEIVGGSMAWNQLAKNGNFADNSNWSTTGTVTFTVSGNTATVTASSAYAGIVQSFSFIAGHKYIMSCDITLTTATQNIGWAVDSSREGKKTTATTGRQNVTFIYSASTTHANYIRILDGRSSGWDAFTVKNVNVIDLTLMFGATVADYIYSLETATAGAGVSFFRSLFNKPYYAYNAGEIVSVNTSAHKMVGFNQWDEEWESGLYDNSGAKGGNANAIRSKNYIKVFPNTEYCIVKPASYAFAICEYDADGKFIDKVWTTSSQESAGYYLFSTKGNVYRLTFYLGTSAKPYTEYDGGICINLSDPQRNGQYEPYKTWSYPLDSSLTLRGIPKLVNNQLVYDGDIYEADGTVTRKWMLIDMGTLTWTLNNNQFYSNQITNTQTSGWNYNVRCSKYEQSTLDYNNNPNPHIRGINAKRLYVVDTTYSTADAFKTAMSGVYALIPLEAPTTETADPYTNPQVCYPGGTEEYIDERTIPVPVGHNTKYLVPIEMTVTNSGNTDSAPTMTITGSGAIEVTIDGLIAFEISMPSTGQITIDSAAMDATDSDNNLANRNVSGDYNNLRLSPGSHTIIVNGDATSVSIRNASRWL